MIRPHTFIVGASPECDIRLSHPSVSGRHARLEVHGKGWRIVDLGSTNGVTIGGERIQTADVAEGSQIAFGSLAVRLGSLLAQANPPLPAEGESWTVGGLPQCDVHVDFPRVSPEHARIRNQGGRLWLSDVASSGGTRTTAGTVRGEVQVQADEPLWLGSLGMSVAEVLWWRDGEAKRDRQSALAVPFTPSSVALAPRQVQHVAAQPAVGPQVVVMLSSTAERQASGETVFLADGGIRITNTRAIFPGITYAMANITTVALSETPPGRFLPSVLLACGVIGGIFGASQGAEEVAAMGAGVAILAVIWLALQKTVYHVLIGSASGAAEPFSSTNRKWVEHVVQAMNEAFIHRG